MNLVLRRGSIYPHPFSPCSILGGKMCRSACFFLKCLTKLSMKQFSGCELNIGLILQLQGDFSAIEETFLRAYIYCRIIIRSSQWIAHRLRVHGREGGSSQVSLIKKKKIIVANACPWTWTKQRIKIGKHEMTVKPYYESFSFNWWEVSYILKLAHNILGVLNS